VGRQHGRSVDSPGAGGRVRRGPAIAASAEAGDGAAVAAPLHALQPTALRGDRLAEAWVQQRTAALMGSGATRIVREVPDIFPLPDPALLANVTRPVLVIAQQADPLHPVDVAQAVAARLPAATLHVCAPGEALWSGRHRVRAPDCRLSQRDLIGAGRHRRLVVHSRACHAHRRSFPDSGVPVAAVD
jgi:3-oxoadipate enol-lactonase